MNGTSGVIVAGGHSTRMGDIEKAVVEIAGKPLVERVAERLTAVTDRLILNCRDDQRPTIEAALSAYEPRFAIDSEPDRGPVAGIATGLDKVETEYAAVVAVDMPFLDPDLVEYLFKRAEGYHAAVPRPGEWFEPLHAIYNPEPMIEACERALESPDPRIIEPLSSLDWTVIDRENLLEHGSLDSFESVDTPKDVQWAIEQLR